VSAAVRTNARSREYYLALDPTAPMALELEQMRMSMSGLQRCSVGCVVFSIFPASNLRQQPVFVGTFFEALVMWR
jgi:hypothetical protein